VRSGTRLQRLAIAAALCAILAGCAGFFYKRLDWLAAWYVNGLVTLDEDQEQALRRMVKDTVAWHRGAQFPLYQAMLDNLDKDVDGPMSVARVEQRYDEMVALWDVMVERLVGDAAPLLDSLTIDQRNELFASIEEQIEDFREEYSGSTAELRYKRRVRTTIRVLQQFMGRLTEEQRMLVRARLATMNDVADEWLERRALWQANFRAVLDGNLRGAEFAAALRDLALRPEQFDSAEYRRKVSQNRQIAFRMLADLSSIMTPKQRERMSRKLREYAAELDELTRQSS
jgi:hypothetical protein